MHLLQLESGKKRGLSWLDEEIARRRRAEEQKEKHGDTEVIPDDPAAQFLLGLSCWASPFFGAMESAFLALRHNEEPD